MLREELRGGRPVPVAKLAVAGRRLEAAVERAVNRPGRHRAADFRSWEQQHVGSGAGVLRKFTNRDNQRGTVPEEIGMETLPNFPQGYFRQIASPFTWQQVVATSQESSPSPDPGSEA